MARFRLAVIVVGAARAARLGMARVKGARDSTIRHQQSIVAAEKLLNFVNSESHQFELSSRNL